MSFLGGPECSTSSNPLGQFQKHLQNDNTLQRDRVHGNGPNLASSNFRNVGASAPQDQAVDGFLNHAPNLQHDLALQGGHLQIDPAHHAHLRANSASPAWAHDFQASHQHPSLENAYKPPQTSSPFSPEEFSRYTHLNSSSTRSSPLPGVTADMQRPGLGVGMFNRGMGFGMMSGPMYPMSYAQQQPMVQQPQQQQPLQDKGKGKVTELDDSQWEEQFASLDLHDQTKTADKLDDMEAELSKMDKALESETNEFGDFESIWKGIEAERLDNDEFQSFAWSDTEANNINDLGRYMDFPSETYMFEDPNAYANHKNPFEEGVRIMMDGGNLSLAALAFEATVQQNPNHVEAWTYLGAVQAQNEKETAAIRALEQTLKLDPNNLAALMGLAISYTNEGYEGKAYRSLERWLAAKYPQVLNPADVQPVSEVGFADRIQLQKRVTDLFIRAAQLSPDGANMDPDVQVGLGVLFYGAEEYDKAVDCFQAALDSSQLGTSNQRGQVHLLWNRLGATLANSGRPEEAVEAYQQALMINPNFVRARYNLGVSCINVNCFEEAAGHFLAALSMHRSIETVGRDTLAQLLGADPSSSSSSGSAQLPSIAAQNISTPLYDTLRRVFNQMDRKDLAAQVVPGVDPEIFRAEFDF